MSITGLFRNKPLLQLLPNEEYIDMTKYLESAYSDFDRRSISYGKDGTPYFPLSPIAQPISLDVENRINSALVAIKTNLALPKLRITKENCVTGFTFYDMSGYAVFSLYQWHFVPWSRYRTLVEVLKPKDRCGGMSIRVNPDLKPWRDTIEKYFKDAVVDLALIGLHITWKT